MTQNRGKYSHNGNADPLFRVYLREMNGYSLLTPEEEKSLAIRYRETGDREATHKLVTGSLRLVVKIVLDIQKEFKRKGRKFPEQLLMDLIQEGNLGLIWAVEKFDPYNGAKLSSYSSIWIECNVRNLIKEDRARILHLDVPRKEGSKESHLDFLLDTGPRADDALAENELQQLFRQRIAEFHQTLDARELDILETRILTDDPATLKGIASRHGISPTRVRQLEDRLIKKLRDYMRSHFLEH
jgi:RNA polymerase sigma-32 factor